jgi:hypothetical protein
VLIDIQLGAVDYATHHLQEGRFLGAIEDAWLALERAQALIDGAPQRSQVADLIPEIDQYRQLIEDWVSYQSSSSEESFPAWCTGLGRNHPWRTIIYYQARKRTV